METLTDTPRAWGTWGDKEAENDDYSVVYISVVSVLLSLIIFSTVAGNLLTMITIFASKDLRTNVSYWLLLSLAFSDLLVSVLVMPLSLKKQLQKKWDSSPVLCDIWITLDVTCCTASIVNVAAIAVDRYCSITQKTSYVDNRRRANVAMVIVIWVLSFLVSLPPLFGWRRDEDHGEPGECHISQDLMYTIFSTIGAFYLPLFVMLACYCKIYKAAARVTFRRRPTRVEPYVPRGNSRNGGNVNQGGGINNTPAVRGLELDAIALYNPKVFAADVKPAECARTGGGGGPNHSVEKRTVVTLGVLIGVFIVCWLPFFLLATILPFCRQCSEKLPADLGSFVLWLGYCNSLFNPLIYTFCHKDYRLAFKKLFCNVASVSTVP